MCGRFVLFASVQQLAAAGEELLGRPVRTPYGAPPERYNIAPTQTIAVLVPAGQDNGDTADLLPARWGLVPAWAEDYRGPVLFNARVETAASKPSFRAAWAQSRCVVPMNGYYEWKDKQPYFVSTGELVWAAGLYSTAQEGLSATVLTTAAAGQLEWLHHRMPVFVDAAGARAWLAGADPQAIVPDFQIVAANRKVGNVRNQGPELLVAQQP